MTTATYQYSVRDPLGNVHQGSVDATSRDDAEQQLRRDGFAVLELQEGDAPPIQIIPRGISQTEIIYLTNQLSIMVDTGITLSAALNGICAQEENPTLKCVMLDLKARVEGGEDFSTALANHSDYFDTTYVAMVRASEQTGSLGTMLERISDYLRKEVETRGKVLAALAYPGVMMVLAIGVTIFLLTYVLPKFEPLFTRKGVALPMPTVVMMTLSGALLNYWWAWMIGAATISVGYFYGSRTELGRQLVDGFKINLPILGPLFRKVAISRSIRTLGTMVGSGVSMLDSLKLASEVAGNYHYEQLWLHVLDRVTTGSTIKDSIQGNPLIPSTLVQMIDAGEETGKLDYVLAKCSDYYDSEVDLSLKTATSLIEPIMITVMGVIVGGIGMALMLPIFKLSSTPG